MKGDFSRLTFDKKKHYSGVRMQQGRVQLDADWNEQLDITAHRIETEITDFIGASGAPAEPKDKDGPTSFRIAATADRKQLVVGAGRYYIAGKLFENESGKLILLEKSPTDVGTYIADLFENDELGRSKMEAKRADATAQAAKVPDKQATDPVSGTYIAYLDVWQQHITALDDPTIREVALGGPDTATRIKNLWQVRLAALKNVGDDWRPEDNWTPAGIKPLSTGRLEAWVNSGGDLQNQLYRVEIHTPGLAGTATFKWSRDNGSVADQVIAISAKTITIRETGRDTNLGFAGGQWVELTHKTQRLKGAPGLLVELETVQAPHLTVTAWPGNKAPKFNDADGWIVRRWDSIGEPKVEGHAKMHLEHDIKVQFEPDDTAMYNSGDYWLIPTRNLSGTIEGSQEDYQPPHGIRHYYVPLALLKRGASVWDADSINDLRSKFKPLTTGLLSKAGDTMDGPLEVRGTLTATELVISYNARKIAPTISGKGLSEKQKLALTVSAGGTDTFTVSADGQVSIGSSEGGQHAGSLTVFGDTQMPRNLTLIEGGTVTATLYKGIKAEMVEGTMSKESFKKWKKSIIEPLEKRINEAILTIKEEEAFAWAVGEWWDIHIACQRRGNIIKVSGTAVFREGVIKSEEFKSQKIMHEEILIFGRLPENMRPAGTVYRSAVIEYIPEGEVTSKCTISNITIGADGHMRSITMIHGEYTPHLRYDQLRGVSMNVQYKADHEPKNKNKK